MKQVWSVAAGLPLAAVVWVLTGIGLVQLASALGGLLYGVPMVLPDAFLSGNRIVTGLAAAGLLLAAGLAFGLLLRVGVAGRAIAGVACLVVGVWALTDPAGFERTFPSSIAGFERAAQAPAWGYALLLAGPLLVTLVQARLNGSLPVGLAIGVLVWVETGIGVSALGRAVGVQPFGEALLLPHQSGEPVPDNRLFDSVIALVFLLGAAILVRLIIDGRRFRAARAVVAAAFIGVSLWAMTFPESYEMTVPVAWVTAPAWGYALLLAGPMLLTAVWPPNDPTAPSRAGAPATPGQVAADREGSAS
jgi:hypothetical protein